MLRWISKIVIISSVLVSFSFSSASAEFIEDHDLKMVEVYHLLKDNHLSNPDGVDISEFAIRGMIESIQDPYTQYFSRVDLEYYLGSLEANYSGIGIVVQDDEGVFNIVELLNESPAEEVGIQVGDVLIAINGLSVEGRDFDTLMSQVAGPVGTKISLTVSRSGKAIEFSMERKEMHVPQVKTELMADQIGYLYLSAFTESALEEFNQGLQHLKQQGAKGLILDLRDNPGGILTVANEIASVFINEGPLVFVKNNNGQEQMIPLIKKDTQEEIPLVVLVNENSASAAEILAAALQDRKRATIIGNSTYGKGTIQEFIPLFTGGYLKLTVEEYFTSLHKPVNNVGVTPDQIILDELEQLRVASSVLTNTYN